MGGGCCQVAAVLCALLCAAAPAAASLPEVPSGPRPGPDVLYADPPSAPQLENAGPWTAPPILVSGATAYRDGEFLYQDHLYDDHGADGLRDPSDPFGTTDFAFSSKRGTATYPTAAEYANNAADLVELRVKPVTGATAFRITLNTLKDPDRVAFTIAIGASSVPQQWPHGAGVRSPAEHFVTVHGSTAELRDGPAGPPRGPTPTVTVDRHRRQFDVRVPHAAWNPGTRTARIAAGVGLWDAAAARYLAPRIGSATASSPGGGGAPSGAALFNVAFRTAEPMPDIDALGIANTSAEGAVGISADATYWRERAQADALATGDVGRFFADVDFAKLAGKADDDTGVPASGHMNRILASRREYAQGVDYSAVCGGLTDRPAPGTCTGQFAGRLQPYAIYVPRKPRPRDGYGMTVLLHGLTANHNEFLGSRHAEQFGERGAGSLVASPLGRGPDGYYRGAAEADVFEVWADVARHYAVDGTWAAIGGYSMGGIGTYRLAARWPDLFGAATPIVGYPDTTDNQLTSLRHVPLMMWNAGQDELVNVALSESGRLAVEQAGLRYESWLFNPAGHITLGNNDEYGPAAEFMGEHRANRAPARVTFVVEPREDADDLGLTGDHAYWLSGLKIRDANAHEGAGTIDARSEAFGQGTPVPLPTRTGSGVLRGGSHGPIPYIRRARVWGTTPKTDRADRLVVNAVNIAAATVDAARARLGCAPQIDLRSDGPLDLRIACRTSRTRRCSRNVTLRLPRLSGQRVTRVTVTRRGRVLRAVRGRDVRRVSFRRASRRAFSVRIRVRTSGGRQVIVLRRIGACRRR